jgi:hypothetical protein
LIHSDPPSSVVLLGLIVNNPNRRTAMKTTTNAKYALLSGRLDRNGGVKDLRFVPGDFTQATSWPVKTSARSVFDHFEAHPGQPIRVPGSLAKKLFGFTDRELWHDGGGQD